MSVIVGIAGARRNAAAALIDDGRAVAVCEQERITRTRGAVPPKGQVPTAALNMVLRVGKHKLADVSSYVLAEPELEIPAGLPAQRLDHHFAHAATSFLTSPFGEASIVVCDRHSSPELTVWRGDTAGISLLPFTWRGPSMASLYSRAVAALGFFDGEEYKLEALARVGASSDGSLNLIDFRGDHIAVVPDFEDRVADAAAARTDPLASVAAVAQSVQSEIAATLVDTLRTIKAAFGGDNLCLAGGLFYNSYLNAAVANAELYERIFVPVNPGNPGVSVGAGLAIEGARRAGRGAAPLSPFLGPEYQDHEIKATLDNCKLSYDFLREGQVVDQAVEAIKKGRLIGWFQGRMEWGPRALGNRSILANPLSPYVLENLNMFLKHREAHRSYSVAVPEEDAGRYFRGPGASPFMEYDYEVLRPDLFQPLMPMSTRRLRVQTVSPADDLFYKVLKGFGETTGVPVLVNTSFNGFHEPIVCTPRDAVRVFFGTGLDMAFLGPFRLHK